MKKLFSLIFPIFILLLSINSCVKDDNNDDDCTLLTWYIDADNDGLGNPEINTSSCTQPDGYVSNSGDSDDTSHVDDCMNNYDVPDIDQSRGDCTEVVGFFNFYIEEISNNTRTITSNNIPAHNVGLFGNVPGSLNPNAIKEQNSSYQMDFTATENTAYTALLGTGQGPNGGPKYSFGILMNGIELDPVAAEPWPHEGFMNPSVNWEWNLEALNVRIGLDCNNAHVQPTGKYHHHGKPTLYLESLNLPDNVMTLIGYAADGFPIYYKYGYSSPMDNTSEIIELNPSYQLKDGERPGDGETAPCGAYNGVYSNDYEYIENLSSLDIANGRNGVTPEYPNGTYYYVLTDEFPSIPRYFRGVPSNDFKLGM